MVQFAWVEGKEIAVDVLTEEGCKREALEEIIKWNFFRYVASKDNLVKYEDDEIMIKNLKCKET